MLRVAITGGLGSGKSTVAALFAQRGAHVTSSDEVARTLMQPGEDVYHRIVERFGSSVVREDGGLDRARLSKLAFQDGRVQELEAIIHPAVLAWQNEWMRTIAASDAQAIVMVESALVFEMYRDHPEKVRERFDRIVLVVATHATQKRRFVARIAKSQPEPMTEQRQTALEEDAERRLSLQMPEEHKRLQSDFVISNDGVLADLEVAVSEIWNKLQTEAQHIASK